MKENNQSINFDQVNKSRNWLAVTAMPEIITAFAFDSCPYTYRTVTYCPYTYRTVTYACFFHVKIFLENY